MPDEVELDKLLKLFIELQKNNQTDSSDLSTNTGYGKDRIKSRVRELTKDGHILRNVSVINDDLAGVTLKAFVQLKLRKARGADCAATVRHIEEFANVQEVHKIGGDFDLLVKIRLRTIEEQNNFLDYVEEQGNLLDSKSLFVTRTYKESMEITLDEESFPTFWRKKKAGRPKAVKSVRADDETEEQYQPVVVAASP